MSTGPSEELEIARRHLAQASKMASLGRLLAAAVHEMNTPLGAVVSNNEVSLRALDSLKRLLSNAQAGGSPPPPKALELVDTLAGLAAVDQIAGERLSSIVRGLRTYSRPDEKQLRLANVHELIEDALKLARPVFLKRVTVEKDYGELPAVECYPHLLGQVFLNLVINAAQAIEGEGMIRVRTWLEGDSVHIAIADTGRGIPEEDRLSIFSSGFTTKAEDDGTGLGLAITRAIVVETHGGAIDFESQPRAGTTFHVRIPIRRT